MNSTTAEQHSPRLLNLVRCEIRNRHYALSTPTMYLQWVRGFVKFHGLRHPRAMAVRTVWVFLSHLANER
jgi:hypothetical protein